MKELKSRIMENGIDYVLVGDYYIPDLKLSIMEKTAPSREKMEKENQTSKEVKKRPERGKD